MGLFDLFRSNPYPTLGEGFASDTQELINRGVDAESTYANILPPARSPWGGVDVDAALAVSSIQAAVHLITTAVSQMDYKCFNRVGELSDTDKTYKTWLKKPDVNSHKSAFIEETVWSMAVYGNAYWRVYGDGAEVQSLRVLHPTNVHPFIEETTGLLKYRYGKETLGTSQIKHLKLNRIPEQIEGYGPLQKHGQEIASIIRLREFADTWFDTSGVPLGYITTDQDTDKDQNKAIAEAWKKFLEEQSIGVLPNGFKYEYVGVNPGEVQFVEVQEKAVRDVARMFNMPAQFLLAEMEGSSTTYYTHETTNLNLIQYCLNSYIKEIEDAMTELLPRGQHVKFNDETLLRADQKTKWEIRNMQIQMGYTNPNELRKNDGLKPLPQPKPVEEVVKVEDNEGINEGESNDL